MTAFIYAKTPAGQDAFRQRDAAMSARQRTAFLLFDGRRRLAEVLADTVGLGVSTGDVQDLVDKGFLSTAAGAAAPLAGTPRTTTASTAAPAAAPAAEPAADNAAPLDPVERYRRAYPMATRLTANLGLRGFRLNLQVEAAAGYDGLVALLPVLAKAAGEDAVRPLREALGIPR